MGAITNNILTITEPTIVVDAYEIIDIESGTGDNGDVSQDTTGGGREKNNDKMSKLAGGSYPSVRVNEYDFNKDHIRSFEMDLTGFIPTVNCTIDDKRGVYQSNNNKNPK